MTEQQKKQIIEQEMITPAFPPQLVQDQYNQLVAPIAGMTKLEYFTLHIHTELLKQSKPFAITDSIQQAKMLIESLTLERIKQQEQKTNSNLSLT